MYKILILTALGYGSNMVIQGAVRQMLIESGQVIKNYQGKDIPNSMGIALILSTTIAISTTLAFGYTISFDNIYIVFAGILMGFAGAIDDFLGNSESKGFKGHIRNLMRGRLTTGGLKAVSGIVSSFIISTHISATYYDMIINVFIISLVTNLINLMDTRPGRAVKFFFLLSIIPVLAGTSPDVHYIVFGILLAYLPIDLKAEGMLGDTGANFIGMIAGIALITYIQSFTIRAALLLFVLGLNLLSEKYSFSKAIERNRVLSYIDHLGRNR